MIDRERPVVSPALRRLTRRDLLSLGAGAVGVFALTACGGADPTPTIGTPSATGGEGARWPPRR